MADASMTQSMARFEPMVEELADGAFAGRRKEAFERFRDGGLPSTREEDWKYTSLRPVERRGFVPATPPAEDALPDLTTGPVPDLDAWRAVFVDGYFRPELSELPQDVEAAPLAPALREGDLPDGFASLVDESHHRLAALNTALVQDGLSLRVPDGMVLERPLYLVWASSAGSADPRVTCPRVYLDMGEDARATVIEHMLGDDTAEDLHLAVTEARLAARSRLAHYRLQEAGRGSFVVSGLHADVAAGARLACHDVDLGAKLSRHDIHVRLMEPEAEVSLKGLYVGRDRQHMDTHTKVEHIAPHTRSVETYKGVLSDKARSVFNGKVHVHRDAQKTEAEQSNDNLLLSEQAEADTKPELEIYADDVKAAHGATVGQLDMDALFYLLSRGLEPETAQELLVFAFADEVLAEMAIEPVRRHLEAGVMRQLPSTEHVSEFVGEVA